MSHVRISFLFVLLCLAGGARSDVLEPGQPLTEPWRLSYHNVPGWSVDVGSDAKGNLVYAWLLGDVYIRRYDPRGNPLAERIEVFTREGDYPEPSRVRIAVNPSGHFVVVWSLYHVDDNHNEWHTVEGHRFDPEGKPVGDAFTVATVSGLGVFPEVAMADDGAFFVAWADSEVDALLVQRYDSDGSRAGDAIDVGRAPSDLAIATVPGSGFVVSWHDSSPDEPAIFFRLYDEAGNALVEPKTVASHSFANTSVAAGHDGDFVLAWSSESKVFARMYSTDGEALSGVIDVQSDFLSGQDPGVAAVVGGGYAISWVSDGTNYMRRYDATMTPLGAEFPTTDSMYRVIYFSKIVSSAIGVFSFAYAGDDGAGEQYMGHSVAGAGLDLAVGAESSGKSPEVGEAVEIAVTVSNNSPPLILGNEAIDAVAGHSDDVIVYLNLTEDAVAQQASGYWDWACEEGEDMLFECRLQQEMAPGDVNADLVVALSYKQTGSKRVLVEVTTGTTGDKYPLDNSEEVVVTVQAASGDTTSSGGGSVGILSLVILFLSAFRALRGRISATRRI